MEDCDLRRVGIAGDRDLGAFTFGPAGEAAGIGVPGGLELRTAIEQVDQAGGGSLEVGGAAEPVGRDEGEGVGRVAGLGAWVELDDERLLRAGEGAQALEQPGEESVGVDVQIGPRSGRGRRIPPGGRSPLDA